MSLMVPSPSADDALTVLRSFLLAISPAGTEVVQGQDNRVSAPEGQNWIKMTTLFINRLATNIRHPKDVFYTARISGSTMTVTDVAYGVLAPGLPVFGLGVAADTVVLSGPEDGGPGDYQVSVEQDLPDMPMASGTTSIVQKAQLSVQLDVYGPASADGAMRISTLFRDPYAVEFMAARRDDMSPLYTDEPRQSPFVNSESQYERRWMVDVHLQTNILMSVEQRFADQLGITQFTDVNAEYPYTRSSQE